MRKRYRRLTHPLVRKNGELQPATWEEAIEKAAGGLGRVAGKKRAASEFGMFSCSKSTNEMNFMAQKFARVVMGSNNIDSCNRT